MGRPILRAIGRSLETHVGKELSTVRESPQPVTLSTQLDQHRINTIQGRGDHRRSGPSPGDPLGDESIASAAHRGDPSRLTGFRFDLGSKTVDVFVDRSGVLPLCRGAPYLVQQLRSRVDLPRRRRHAGKQVKLFCGELNLAAVNEDIAAPNVNHEVPEVKSEILTLMPSPQHRVDPGYKFARVEWLDNIVIRTELQADDSVRAIPSTGEHDDGNVPCGAQPSENIEPGNARKAEVEDDEVGRATFYLLLGSMPILGLADLKAVLDKCVSG
jgi:hypothetical protein